MIEKSRKLIEELKENITYAIDAALDGDLATGYLLCEDPSGAILVDKETAKKREYLHPKCRYSHLKPRAEIIIAPK